MYYRLRPVDISVMKKLHHKVNIVPLVAKADMLTKKEIKNLKEKVITCICLLNSYIIRESNLI